MGRGASGWDWPPRLWWLAVVALAIQIVAVYGVEGVVGEGRGWVILLTYALLLGTVVANRQSWGMRLVGAGIFLNFMAMVANGGMMPVTLEALHRAGLDSLATGTDLTGVIPGSKDVLMPREAIHLYQLTDVIVLSFPWRKVYSLGDLVLMLGLASTAVEYIWYWTRGRRRPQHALIEIETSS